MDISSLQQLFSLFGVDGETFVSTAGMVFLVMSWLKSKWPGLSGWRTDVVAIIVGAALAYKVLDPVVSGAWVELVFYAVGVYVIPAGLHERLRGTTLATARVPKPVAAPIGRRTNPKSP